MRELNNAPLTPLGQVPHERFLREVVLDGEAPVARSQRRASSARVHAFADHAPGIHVC